MHQAIVHESYKIKALFSEGISEENPGVTLDQSTYRLILGFMVSRVKVRVNYRKGLSMPRKMYIGQAADSAHAHRLHQPPVESPIIADSNLAE
jgi:hypothetical protein